MIKAAQGYVKIHKSTLSRPLGHIEGCGHDPFAPFDTRFARGTLWVQDAHSIDFDVALKAAGCSIEHPGRREAFLFQRQFNGLSR